MRYVLAVVLLSGAASAQPEVGLDVGLAVPQGSTAVDRVPGVVGAVSLATGTDRRGAGFRAEASAQWIPGRAAPSRDEASQHRSYRAYSGRLSLIYTLSDRPATLYTAVGVGAYSSSERGPREAEIEIDMFTGGAHVGLGVRVPIGGAALVAETQAVAVMTDPLLVNPETFYLLTVGVRL